MTREPGRPGDRLDHLDALRGIAAALVLVHHCFILLPPPFDRPTMQMLAMTPLAPLVAGQPLVIVFFVLSGLVLTIALERPVGFAAFALRRVLRLWLPLAAAVLLAFALSLAFGGRSDGAGFADWFPRVPWNRPDSIDLELLARHLALTGRLRDEGLNTVIWSLAIELRLSLAMPLMALAVRRRPTIALGACLAIGAAAELALFGALPGVPRRLLLGDGLFLIDDWAGTALATLAVLPAFALGSWLAVHRGWLAGRRLSPGALVLAAVAVAVGLGIPSVVAASAAAAGLLALATTDGPLRRGLRHPALLFLGLISYPLYLTHFPVLHAAINLADGTMPPAAVLALGALGAVLLAVIFQRLVERPAIGLSRRVGRGGPPRSLERP